jgi:hypothetical protein
MRGSAHSVDIYDYDINLQGIVIGERLKEYTKVITGIPLTAKPYSDGDLFAMRSGFTRLNVDDTNDR